MKKWYKSKTLWANLLDTREQRERIIKVEESSKQAHKRIDELAGRRTG